ncbi:MAG: FabA-like domain, partial [Blastocatellia bacterium]|nr:FabA-like domain [Blastocatellia bacterium]
MKEVQTLSTMTVLDIRAIQELLPHRPPFLLVDRIIELVPR